MRTYKLCRMTGCVAVFYRSTPRIDCHPQSAAILETIYNLLEPDQAGYDYKSRDAKQEPELRLAVVLPGNCGLLTTCRAT